MPLDGIGTGSSGPSNAHTPGHQEGEASALLTLLHFHDFVVDQEVERASLRALPECIEPMFPISLSIHRSITSKRRTLRAYVSRKQWNFEASLHLPASHGYTELVKALYHVIRMLNFNRGTNESKSMTNVTFKASSFDRIRNSHAYYETLRTDAHFSSPQFSTEHTLSAHISMHPILGLWIRDPSIKTLASSLLPAARRRSPFSNVLPLNSRSPVFSAEFYILPHQKVAQERINRPSGTRGAFIVSRRVVWWVATRSQKTINDIMKFSSEVMKTWKLAREKAGT